MALVVGRGVVADDPEQSAGRIWSSVMSPYCPGRTLSACPSEEAMALRSEVRAMFAAGMNEEGVRARLQERFGQAIDAEPSWHGAGLLGWLVPILFLLAGAAVILFRVARGVRNREEGSAGLSP